MKEIIMAIEERVETSMERFKLQLIINYLKMNKIAKIKKTIISNL